MLHFSLCKLRNHNCKVMSQLHVFLFCFVFKQKRPETKILNSEIFFLD